jgi:nucleoside phosphorylase
MDSQSILLVTPTWVEAYAVRRGLRQASRKVPLMICGMGPAHAAAFCRRLHPRTLGVMVLLGWAGGLTGELQTGDAIIASHVLMHGKNTLVPQQLSIPGTTIAPMITSPKVLKTGEEKRKARCSGALAVEMEAYPLVDWMHQHKIPFIHARVILDTLDESLPRFRLIKSGNAQPRAALKNPQVSSSEKRTGGLFGWIRRFKQANAQLSVLAVSILQALDDNDNLEYYKPPIR